MRATTIVALLALFCLLSIAFATEGVAASAPIPPAPAAPAVDNTQLINLQSKVSKLDADLAELRKTLAQMQQENKSLIAKIQEAQSAANPVQPKPDPRVSKMDEAVNALRFKVEQLTKQINESTWAASVQHSIKVATVFFFESVWPKLEQAIKVTQVYTAQAMVQAKPMLGKTQGLLSRVYHQIRAYHQQGKDIFVTEATPIAKQLSFLPTEHRSLFVQAVWNMILFVALFTVFMIFYSIWKAMFSCCRSKKATEQPQQSKKDVK